MQLGILLVSWTGSGEENKISFRRKQFLLRKPVPLSKLQSTSVKGIHKSKTGIFSLATFITIILSVLNQLFIIFSSAFYQFFISSSSAFCHSFISSSSAFHQLFNSSSSALCQLFISSF